MNLPNGVNGDAQPAGKSGYRHWLSRTWNSNLQTALVIGINPNTATEAHDDQTTKFLHKLLSQLDGKYKCGKYILVNLFDFRDSEPSHLSKVAKPDSGKCVSTISNMLKKCNFIVASWGTTSYGQLVENRRTEVSQLVLNSNKEIICFSPKGKPIHCSPRNANSRDGRWSATPFPYKS